MSSDTQQTENRRKNKTRKAGKDRKRSLDNKGTTPPFAIHVDSAAKAS